MTKIETQHESSPSTRNGLIQKPRIAFHGTVHREINDDSESTIMQQTYTSDVLIRSNTYKELWWEKDGGGMGGGVLYNELQLLVK